jgi:hypothetical protein
MPRGNVTPRDRSLQRLSLLEKQVRETTSRGTLQKIKTLLRDYTTGVTSSKPQSDRVKALRRKIAKREESLLKNSNKLPSGGRL